MRIRLACMQCFGERGEPDHVFYAVEIQDSGLYPMKCRFGHETVTCVQEQKFEVLFELALNAIVDGYYRDAVASFASALERFQEFYIRVVCLKHGMDRSAFADTWKKVSKQSERQLGAYMFVYLLERNSLPPTLPETESSFRNDVIHKGLIPTQDEAIRFGQKVLDIIAPTLAMLKEHYPDQVHTAVMEHIQKTRGQIKGMPRVSFMSIGSCVSIARALSEPQPSVAEEVMRLKGRKIWAG
jgi:hypothetical protein